MGSGGGAGAAKWDQLRNKWDQLRNKWDQLRKAVIITCFFSLNVNNIIQCKVLTFFFMSANFNTWTQKCCTCIVRIDITTLKITNHPEHNMQNTLDCKIVHFRIRIQGLKQYFKSYKITKKLYFSKHYIFQLTSFDGKILKL